MRRSTLERPKQSLRLALSVRCEKSFSILPWHRRRLRKKETGTFPSETALKSPLDPISRRLGTSFGAHAIVPTRNKTRAPAPGIGLPPRRCRDARKSNSEHLMREQRRAVRWGAPLPVRLSTRSRPAAVIVFGALYDLVWERKCKLQAAAAEIFLTM